LPEAVIFDVDGTLVDTVSLHAQAWADTFRHFGVDVSVEDVRRQIGKGGDQLMPVFLDEHTLLEQGDEIERYRSDLFKRCYFDKARAFPAVRDLFVKLREANTTIAVGSSCKADELDHYLGLAGVADLVSVRTTSADAARTKPYPDIFKAALQALGEVAGRDVVVIGDSPYDAEAARRAGLASVGLLSGGFAEEELRVAGCVAVYRDPRDLLDNLDASPLAGGAPAAADSGA
jgi:HAD superfamily hydrolase (TIGR01509 family)